MRSKRRKRPREPDYQSPDYSSGKKRMPFLTVCFAAALAVVLCPLALNAYNNCNMKQAAARYSENISELDESDLKEAYERAVSYNAGLKTSNALFEDMTQADAYESCLNLSGDGMMGTLEIPSIGVNLPIYHYTTDDVLNKGIGHVETSALPVGGEGTRCILAGHRGLPGSRLLTYLDEVEVGDLFYLNVLNETLAYKVIEIEVVEPEDVDSLATEKGKDLCTIVTCTPYGVNSHRLLVTGERTEYTEETQDENTFFLFDYILLIAAAGECVVYLIIRRKKTAKTKASAGRGHMHKQERRAKP